MSFDFLSVIKNIAPMIAGTVLGPFGGLAAKAIISVLPGDKQEGAEQALAGGSEGFLQHVNDLFRQGVLQAAELKKAELVHTERMAELGYKNVQDLAKIDADDRDSARKREIAVRDVTPALLAYGVTAGFFGILAWMLVNGVPKQGGDALLLLLGSLGTAWTGIVAYYFGSSAGSAKKDDTIKGMAGK